MQWCANFIKRGEAYSIYIALSFPDANLDPLCWFSHANKHILLQASVRACRLMLDVLMSFKHSRIHSLLKPSPRHVWCAPATRTCTLYIIYSLQRQPNKRGRGQDFIIFAPHVMLVAQCESWIYLARAMCVKRESRKGACVLCHVSTCHVKSFHGKRLCYIIWCLAVYLV